MNEERINHIGIVGGGVMGGGIGHIAATAGYAVTFYDISDEALDNTRHEVLDGKWGIKRSVEKGKLSFDQGAAAIGLLKFSPDLNALADCDLIIEAVPERLELKQDVFADLDQIIKKEAIFASNTSGFVIEEIAAKVSAERKNRFIGLHYSNPVPAMTMLEIIYTPQCSQETIDRCVIFGEKTKRTISMVKDTPGTRGFIMNRIFAAARREAVKIVEDGIATKEDVDKAMISGRKWPAAFFGSRGGIGKQW